MPTLARSGSSLRPQQQPQKQQQSVPVTNKVAKTNKRVWKWFLGIVGVAVILLATLLQHVHNLEGDLQAIHLSTLPSQIQHLISQMEERALGFLPDHFYTSHDNNANGWRPRRRLSTQVIPNFTQADVYEGVTLTTITVPHLARNGTVLKTRQVKTLRDASFDPKIKWNLRRAHVRVHASKRDETYQKYKQQQERVRDPLSTDYLFYTEVPGNDSETTILQPRSLQTPVGRLPFFPTTKHLGVLLDAGRHYFSIEWIQNLLDVLEQLNFNLVHFRLTDDQAFNVLLESHPELANPAPLSNGFIVNASSNDEKQQNPVYTAQELRDLVQYAKQRRIILMPEINVPGHAGGWAGHLPNIIVPCAGFCCSHGYGLPLNMTFGGLMDLLRDVIGEVMDIFHTSPYLHLGGDEVNMAQPCFNEAHQKFYDYNVFEYDLRNVLDSLNISQDQVLRWEMSGQKNVKFRNGNIPHYWMTTNYMPRPGKSKKQTDVKKPEKQTVFVSNGLYFDTNQQQHGWHVYQETRRLVSQPEYLPLGVTAGTFELGTDFWVDRNVIGRLLAVAMGVSNLTWTEDEFASHYMYYCRMLDLPMEVCALHGAPVVEEFLYKEMWHNWTDRWKESFCNRLTYSDWVPEMIDQSKNKASILKESTDSFWKRFGKPPVYPARDVKGTAGDTTPLVPYNGIILDLVQDGSPGKDAVPRIKGIIDFMHSIGMNMLQLRLMSDYGFALQLRGHSTSLSWNVDDLQYKPYQAEDIAAIVEHAASKGIQVVPEISLATRAGGWTMSGFATPCASTICTQGLGGTVDITTDKTFLAVLSSVIAELRESFSSDFIHLGHDERKEGNVCFKEASVDNPDFDQFERKVNKLMEVYKIPLDKVIRWENKEGTVYPSRTGKVTQYRLDQEAPSPTTGEPYFVSINLQDPASKLEDAWDVYSQAQQVVSNENKPTAVLAWVESIASSNWKDLNIEERLLAMTMGLRKDSIESKDELQPAFDKQLKLQSPRDKNNFGKIPDAEKSRQRYQEAIKERQDKSCKVKTKQTERIFPVKGVLVPLDGNVQDVNVEEQRALGDATTSESDDDAMR